MSSWRGAGVLLAGLLVLAVLGAVTVRGEPGERSRSANAARIEALLASPEVARGIERWGLSVADVRHDVHALAPHERDRLAAVLYRRWPSDTGYSEADYRAQLLVTVSLLRASTLVAGVVGPGLRFGD